MNRAFLPVNGSNNTTRLWPVCLLALLACFLPLSSGAYEIGHTSITFVDAGRGNREVLTEIYYPALSAEEDAPPASPPDGGFPVIAFGHGYLISWSDYDYIWEGLVPAGFVVALPATAGELFPDHLDFGRDLAFVSRAVRAEGSNPASLFYGVISGAAALGGHSMGGGASFLGTAEDSTVSALFNLAAAETNPSAIAAAAEIEIPTLLFSGSVDCVTPPADHQTPMYDALASLCKTHVTLEGASHCQFAENNFFCNLGEGGCPDLIITRTEQHDLTLAVLTPWLHAVLVDDWSSWAAFQAAIDTLPGVTYVQDCSGAGLGLKDQLPTVGNGLIASLATFPNPSQGGISFRFTLSRSARIAMDIVSPSGRLVDRIVHNIMPAGTHTLTWDARHGEAHDLALGVYFFSLAADGETHSGRLVLSR